MRSEFSAACERMGPRVRPGPQCRCWWKTHQVKWAKRNDATVQRIARDGETFVSNLLLHHGVDCLSPIQPYCHLRALLPSSPYLISPCPARTSLAWPWGGGCHAIFLVFVFGEGVGGFAALGFWGLLLSKYAQILAEPPTMHDDAWRVGRWFEIAPLP